MYAAYVAWSDDLVHVTYRARHGDVPVDRKTTLPRTPSLALKVQRAGNDVFTLTSQDGKTWAEVPGTRVALGLGSTVQAGASTGGAAKYQAGMRVQDLAVTSGAGVR